MRFDVAKWQFPLILVLLLSALLRFPAHLGGDVVEYALDTIALADHGTPDIRLADIERAKALMPQYAKPLSLLEQGIRTDNDKLYAAFVGGREGKFYSVHFFGYSLLAVAPFKLFEALHLPPFKAFQVVNLAAVFILGLALRRFFGSGARALAGVGLFMLCGGALYFSWTSPECMTAACLLAGMLLFASGAPIAGALLAGLAAQQNPTIVFFFGFAPLLLLLQHRAGEPLVASVRTVLGKRNLAGLAAGAAVFALPPLFNLYQFGVPNIIAKLFSDASLIGVVRLESFFFDLNQGMVIAIPAVLAALLLWGWRGAQDAKRRALLLGAATLFTLALALPALAVLNWNSGAVGVMRYAFWAAMPFLFALLLRLRGTARWPAPLVAGVAVVQLACMLHAASYSYVEFSPLARIVLAHAPGFYHPDPEIFAERVVHNDEYIQPDKVYAYRVGGQAIKTLVNAANPHADALLCGSEALVPGNTLIASARGWRYIDGPVHCVADTVPRQNFQADHFATGDEIKLVSGWSGVERNGGAWNGVWSEGGRSRLVVSLGHGVHAATLALVGHYLDGNKRTRLKVNGADLGWHQLDQEGPIALPPALLAAATLEIELEHEAPRVPGPGDPRPLALFLREVSVRGAGPSMR